MRALITGVGGFVGRHLARSLTEQGDVVCGLVRPGQSSAPHTAGLPERLRLFEADIRDAAEVERAVAIWSPDVIFHLAALSHVGRSWQLRRETYETNFLGAFAVLEAARRLEHGPRVLLVGSAEEYGRGATPDRPFRETDPLNAVTPYGASKVAQEVLGRQYVLGEAVKVVFARPFNHTGPGQAPSFVIPEWASQIAEFEAGIRPPVLEVGNLDARRDFSDVRDIVRLYRTLALEGRVGEAYNACSGKLRSLREVIETLRSRALVEFEVKSRGRDRPSDVDVVVGSADKAQRELGWRRKIPFEKTIAAVLDDWRRRVRIATSPHESGPRAAGAEPAGGGASGS